MIASKPGDVVRIRDGFRFYTAMISTVGTKYITVQTVGVKSEVEKYDKETGYFVEKSGLRNPNKCIC